jgi:hypothetical protein
MILAALRSPQYGTTLPGPMGITVVDRAIDHCRASRRRLDASCRLLAESRLLLSRASRISGG